MWCLLPETHTLIRQNNFAHTPKQKMFYSLPNLKSVNTNRHSRNPPLDLFHYDGLLYHRIYELVL